MKVIVEVTAWQVAQREDTAGTLLPSDLSTLSMCFANALAKERSDTPPLP